MPHCRRCSNFSSKDDLYAQGNIQKLYSSADNGCSTCAILQRAVQGLLSRELPLDSEYVLWSSKISDRTDMLHPDDTKDWQVSLRVSGESPGPHGDIQIYALPEDPSPWDIVPLERHLPTATYSEESYAFATQALLQCLTSHKLCNNQTGDFLPLRLVDVGTSGASSVRVIETLGMDPTAAKYCALSHCWGPPETITTQLNDRTYEEYKKGIPVSALPKTFFDAVVFTRKLGQRYIWIDSLCIIQGNRDDWLTEGAKMCKIYENSLVTLSAASSSNGHGGLFYKYERLEIAGGTPQSSGQPYRVFARFAVNHRFFDFPLMNRAWVLQERLLSPRTLFFTSQELVWECRSCNVCQCSPILGGFTAQTAGFPVNSKLQPIEKHLEGSALVSKWHEVVEVYSQLKLTKGSDKLMAIDGIAQYMGPIRGSQVYAGLWTDSLASDLAWTVDTFDRNRSRALEWRAPTWSWASMDSEIRWLNKDQVLETESHFAVERWPEVNQSGEIQPWARTSPDACLRLRGVLVKTTLAEADIVVGSSPCYFGDSAEWSPLAGHTQDDEPFYCLRLLESKECFYSLVLRRAGFEGQNLYSRHGLLIFNGDPNRENDVWNSRDKTRTKWSRNLQKGYPQWWIGESIGVVNII
ncbi:heterokaryon incompatibility protein-domain-containing protein [Hypoxylon sp. NC1633]|nr:heterokaryon incompatibility protein-domain-containing protein [Hypoxylon sp. NC1633]